MATVEIKKFKKHWSAKIPERNLTVKGTTYTELQKNLAKALNATDVKVNSIFFENAFTKEQVKALEKSFMKNRPAGKKIVDVINKLLKYPKTPSQ